MVGVDEGGRDVGGVAGGGGDGYGDCGVGLMWMGKMRLMGVCGVWLMSVEGLGRQGRAADGLD